MSITIRELAESADLGLEIVAGLDGADHAIRWVHTSEIPDPTPWLSGGELILTTGLAVGSSAAAQRTYIERLAARGLAGLGFGVGFGWEKVPPALVKAADKLGFPIVEVPYPTPFLAISEAVAKRITEERLRDAQLSVEVHERLAMLVTEGAGPADVLEEVTALAGGWAMLFDLRGEALATSPGPMPEPAEVFARLPRGLTERNGATTSTESTPHGTTFALAVTAGKRHEAILVFGKADRLSERDRIVVHHATTVLGLLLASRRAVIDAERRVAGDILSDALAGRISGADLDRKIDLLGFQPAAPLTVLMIELQGIIDAAQLEDLAWTVDGILGARAETVRTTLVNERIAALVAHEQPVELAQAIIQELGAAHGIADIEGSVRVGVGETVERAQVRHSYLSAVFALRAGRAGSPIASPDDLGSYSFLLGAQSPTVLEGYVRSVLGPLIERDEQRSSELVASVKAFVENGGRWEPGADALGVHRHTLRYRIHQAEELLGRNLSSPQDQLEVWLALKAMEILDE